LALAIQLGAGQTEILPVMAEAILHLKKPLPVVVTVVTVMAVVTVALSPQ
jgi:hypothetical protein